MREMSENRRRAKDAQKLCEQAIEAVKHLLKRRDLDYDDRSLIAECSQLESLTSELGKEGSDLLLRMYCGRIMALDCRNRDLSNMLALADRKAAHGCTDACCPECDG